MKSLRTIMAGLIVAATLVPVSCAKAIANPTIAPPAGKTWALAFEAGFDGDALDATKFTPCFDFNTGDCTSSFNKGKEHYLPSQVKVSDGIAHLVAEPLNPPYDTTGCYNGVCTYKSGLLATSRPNQTSPYLYSFTYGYIEARLKLPTTPGMFSAFWMLPTHTDYKYNFEIDILENLAGKPDTIYQTYHYDDRKSNYRVNDLAGADTNGNCPKLDYSADFHTYSADWQPDHVAFFIDGTECGRFSATDASQISSEPMQVILNLMVDNNWERTVNLVLPSQDLTDHLDVDYIRVWQAN